MNATQRRLVGACLFLAMASPGWAQELRPGRADAPIQLDGILDEDAWSGAAVADGFVQQRPHTGEPAGQPTEVRILYSEDALYFGFTCAESSPEAIYRKALGRDQDLSADDYLTILLDTFHDRQNGYLFQVNPNGVRRDALFRNEGDEENSDWNGIWRATVVVTDRGWQGEIEIPWRTLRFPTAARVTMGINFERQRRVVNEQSQWVLVDRQFSVLRISQAGALVGLEGIRPGGDILVQPYALTRLERGEPDPYFEDKATGEFEVGLDLKLGFNSEITLDLTVNTDFAQVEVDDQEVNLTRFPLFYPEKREFFLEKRDFFNFGSFANRPFFSRSIGIQSFDEPLPGVVVPIDYGARLTGKVGRTDLGLLHMETSASDGLPARSFQVARFSRDVGQRSRLGVIGTRRGSKELDGMQEPTNWAGGLDGDFGLTDEIDFRAFGATSSEKDAGPDDATWGAGLSLTYPDWNVLVVQEAIGTDYAPQVGFVQRPGVNQTIIGLGHTPQVNWSMPLPGPDLSVSRFENHANFQWIDRRHGDRETRYIHLHPLVIGAGESEFGIIYENSFERLFDPFPLGGDVVFPVGDYDFDRWGLNVGTDPSRSLSAELTAFDGGFFDADQKSLTVGASYLLPPHVTTSVEYERERIERVGTAGDMQRFESDLLRLRLELDVSNSLTLNLFTQWNETESLLLSQIRGHYIFGDESDIYVVITDDRADGSGDFNPRRGEWVLKLNYARRI